MGNVMIDNYQEVFLAHEPITDRFLETLRKYHTNWQNDKELVKIVKKMEKGKNLKKKEFSRVQSVLWKIGQCSR
jgi:hypothetical protein